MQIKLEPTDRIETVEGLPHRVWKGETDKGVPLLAWIAIVEPQTHDAEQLASFENELRKLPCRRELVSFDLRMVL